MRTLCNLRHSPERGKALAHRNSPSTRLPYDLHRLQVHLLKALAPLRFLAPLALLSRKLGYVRSGVRKRAQAGQFFWCRRCSSKQR